MAKAKFKRGAKKTRKRVNSEAASHFGVEPFTQIDATEVREAGVGPEEPGGKSFGAAGIRRTIRIASPVRRWDDPLRNLLIQRLASAASTSVRRRFGPRILRSAQTLRSATVKCSRNGLAFTMRSRLVRPVKSALAITSAASELSGAESIATAPAPPAKWAK